MSAFSVEALWRSLSDAHAPPSPASSAFGAAARPGQAWTRTPGPSGLDDRWSFGRSPLSRVTRLRHAIDDSVPLAFEQLQRLLGAISFADVRQVLVTLVRDIALVWCGSVILGGGVGGVIGAIGGGVGAVPGAALGASVGASAGEALLALFGLKALAQSMASSMPRALRAYQQGARDAWDDPPFHGTDDGHESFRTRQAAWELAQGHLALLQALLTALLAMLSRGGTARALALHEIGANARLGPAMARWLVAQEDALRRALSRATESRESDMARRAATSAAPAVTPSQLRHEALAEESPARQPVSTQNKSQRDDNAVATVDRVQARLQELSAQGHGVQRHGAQVTRAQLEGRAAEGLDPMTGTTIDGVHGGKHQYAQHATKVVSDEAYVFGESHGRNSQRFIDATSASTTGRVQLEIPLREIYGEDFREFVCGVTRYGPKPAPAGLGNTIFDDDSYMIIRYKQNSSGAWDFNTMFPQPE